MKKLYTPFYHNVHKIILCTALLLFSITESHALVVTWDGGAGTNNWEDADNWSTNQVPTAVDYVEIHGSTYHVIISTNVSALNLQLFEGSLTIKSNATLSLNNAVNNPPYINYGATLELRTNATLTVEENANIVITNAQKTGLSLLFDCTLNNLGTISVIHYLIRGITISENSHCTNTGTIIIESNTSNNNSDGLDNQTGSTFVNSGTIEVHDVQGNSTDGITNLSSFTNEASGVINIDGASNNAGSIYNSTLNGLFKNYGHINITNTTEDAFSNYARFEGDGTYTAWNFLASGQTGELSPASASSSVAKLIFNTDFTQTPFPKYIADISGNGGSGIGHDQTIITGDLSLAGNIKVNLLNGFVPNPNDSYTLMVYTGTRTGTFSGITLPPALSGWIIDYNTPGQVILKNGTACTNALNTWTGTAGDSKWETPGNWALSHKPLPCEDVLINGAFVMISSSDAAASTVKLLNGGSIEIAANATLNINATDSGIPNAEGAVHAGGDCGIFSEGTLNIENAKKSALYIEGGFIQNNHVLNISNYATNGIGSGVGIFMKQSGSVGNDGTLTINSINGSTGIYNNEAYFTNNGDLEIHGVSNNYGIENSGQFTEFYNKSNIQIDEIAGEIEMINDNGASYLGSGSITAEKFQNGSTGDPAIISPGNSPGVTTITGDFEQASTGNYKAEIAGDNGAGDAMGHDQIAVTGDVTLGGTLDIFFLGGFVPDNTKTYNLMTYSGTLTGTFATVNNLPTGWIVDYGVHIPGQISVGLESLLPVEFIDFTVRVENKKRIVHCLWSTAQEINNELFIVERSKDGKNFEEIGNKKGAGTSLTVNTYSFEDRNPLPGINYYRIRQVDYDKKMSFSEIKSTYLDERSKISFYPNPVSDLIQIENSTSLPITNYRIYNALGQLIENGVMNVEKMDIKHLAAGVYHIELLNSTTTLGNIRIIKK